jgi:hypothetical protein
MSFWVMKLDESGNVEWETNLMIPQIRSRRNILGPYNNVSAI